MKIYGYARVSSKEQNLERQVEALQKFHKDVIILEDKQSGKDFNRDSYNLLKKVISTGDTLVVKEMDRLGRNKQQIKEELQYYENKGIRVVILDIPTTCQDLSNMEEGIAKEIVKMINNILIEVMATMAQAEREKIKTRQAEGIAIAKAKGKHLGRPKAEYPPMWDNVYPLWKANTITAKEAMVQLNLKRTTFYKLVKDYE